MPISCFIKENSQIPKGRPVNKRALILSPLFLLAACSTTPPAPEATPATVAPMPVFRPVRLTAIGYGATTPYDSYTPGQKRLMAMRASKLDAYRALVEQAYGVRITSNSTIAGLVAQHDSFRVYMDAYLRGAKVVTVTPLAEGNYETVLELELNEQFYHNMMQLQPQNGSTIPVRTSEALNCGVKGSVGPGCGYGTNFYYSE